MSALVRYMIGSIRSMCISTIASALSSTAKPAANHRRTNQTRPDLTTSTPPPSPQGYFALSRSHPILLANERAPFYRPARYKGPLLTECRWIEEDRPPTGHTLISAPPRLDTT